MKYKVLLQGTDGTDDWTAIDASSSEAAATKYFDINRNQLILESRPPEVVIWVDDGEDLRSYRFGVVGVCQ